MRFPDWEQRLAEYLQGVERQPRVWGVNDCGMFTAGAVQAMTGRDLAGELRGEYHTEWGALRALRQYVGRRSEGVAEIDATFGWLLGRVAESLAARGGLAKITPPTLAQRGDAVLLGVETSLGTQVAMGIIGLNGFPVTVGESGLVEIRTARILAAWKV